MTRKLLAACIGLVMLGACAANPDSYVAGRADNDLLRFSAMNIAAPDFGPR